MRVPRAIRDEALKQAKAINLDRPHDEVYRDLGDLVFDFTYATGYHGFSFMYDMFDAFLLFSQADSKKSEVEILKDAIIEELEHIYEKKRTNKLPEGYKPRQS